MSERTCVGCDTVVTGKADKRWCSARCRNRASRNRWAELPCTDCGSVGGLGWWVGAYKIPGAAGSRCKPCYLAYTRRRHTPTPAPYRSTPAKNTAPKGARWERIRQQVIAEESLCGFCGEPVDKSLTFPNPRSACVDHIVPWRDGGAKFDRDNLRLAHFVCNSSANRSEAGKQRRLVEAALLRRYRSPKARGALVDVQGFAI